ncbi:MAG: RNA polymerase sigma-70 factor [Cyclobacteriaceae bacterium]|nr:RNA polymerase sigma-70 factor [Cyclobacteriaceae bacterium]
MDYSEDWRLWEEVKKGNARAFEKIFNRYYLDLCGFSFQITRDKEGSEEVVSDVLANLWLRRTLVDIEVSLKSYLFRSVRNWSLNHIRKKSVPTDTLDIASEFLLSTNIPADSDLMLADLKNQIGRVVDQMPIQRRTVFKLTRVDQFSYKEVSHILGISVSTVQNHMVEAIKHLEKYKNLLRNLC